MVAKNIEDNIRKFLVKKNIKADRRLIIFLFFVVLSTIFWFLNQLEEEYVTEISLPVRYTNIPSEKILVNELPDHFDIRVRAHGYKLLEYKISNKFLPFQINVNSISLRLHSKSGYSMFYSLTRFLDKKIENQLSSELEIVSISPDTLYFQFAERIFKKVPVISGLKAAPATQYMIRGDITFNPDSITISGADPIIDTINEVYTKQTELTELETNYSDDIKLEKINNVTLSEDKVDVTINVEKFTEGSQKVMLNIINVPDSLVIRTFPKEITVTYFVALSDYEKVLPQLFEAVVDYNETANQDNKLNISIHNSPDYIQSLRFNPKSVEYIIERK
ncbi:MAG: hypothetical protein KOO66_03095 [Bacteroidales bacterium]|nr:hypothetical protein [Bacteroidales bacterium]